MINHIINILVLSFLCLIYGKLWLVPCMVGAMIVFNIIVKNDLHKIQAERMQLNNEEILKQFEEDMKNRKKVKK